MKTVSLHPPFRLPNFSFGKLLLCLGIWCFWGHAALAQVTTDSITISTDTLEVPPTDSIPKVGKAGRGGNRPPPPKVDGSNDTIVNGNIVIIQDTTTSVVRRKDSKKDSTLSRRQIKIGSLTPPDPDVALRRSFLLPGWGQVYNRSAWKVPIIWAGFGGLGYLFVDSNRQFKYYRDAAICAAFPTCDNNDNIEEFEGLSQNNIIEIREFYRRNRDFSVILAGLWYLINGVDAYIEAHLQPFDVSDDLSLRIRPAVTTDPFHRRNVYLGAGISLGFRK